LATIGLLLGAASPDADDDMLLGDILAGQRSRCCGELTICHLPPRLTQT
jgi:hypothetical protein